VKLAFLVWALAIGVAPSVAAEDSIRRALASAEWIWLRPDRDEGSSAYFRCVVDIPERAVSARMVVLTDFCDATIYLNGDYLADVADYGPTREIDVHDQLLSGQNVIAIRCERSPGPTALALRMNVKTQAGGNLTFVTDAQWLAAPTESPQWKERLSHWNAGQAGWSPAMSLGPLSRAEWDDASIPVNIEEADDYTQWMRALNADPTSDPATFRLAPGFAIELIHAARPEEGSWVSLEFDSHGRPIIAREDRGLLCMTLSPDGRRVTTVETIDDTLQECRGLLWAYDSLYVNANNSKGLYRLRDTNLDDRFDEITLLHEFPGGVGHGRNDLTLGPDGLIYTIHGDSVEMPAGFFDRTSPFGVHRRRPQTAIGHVLRTDQHGQQWEIVATGLRNPYGLDFQSDGEMFTYDADAEFDMGSPWYRPTRVNHVVSGADFGWQAVTGSWPPYFPDHPDNSPPNLDIGKGSPTAVKFGTRSNFPPHYQRALFILDWAYGRIIAVHLTPRGASYRARAETIVKGRPLNVTDLGFGPDGAMYVVTGGRKTRAGLYRITFNGPPDAVVPTNPRQEERAKRAADARALRRRLEQFHARPDVRAVDEVWPHLGSPDPWVRYAARIALEHQPLKTWRDRALRETEPTAALTALLALARGGDRSTLDAVLTRLNQLVAGQLSRQRQEVALYAGQLAVSQLGTVSRESQIEFARLWKLRFPTESPEWNRRLAMFLVSQDAQRSLETVLDRLRCARDPRDRMLYLFLLRDVRSGWTRAGRIQYFNALRDAMDYQGGEGMPGFWQRIRADSLATLTAAEQAELASILSVQTPPEPTAATAAPPRPFIRKWTVTELNELPHRENSDESRKRGRALFDIVSCSRCHRIGDHGSLVGPDLTFVSSRFSRRDILAAVVTPSLVVADNYRSVRVITTDGRIVSGRLVPSGDYRSPSLRIATDPLSPLQTVEIEKNRIESSDTLPISWMPEGLLDTLTETDIADLLAYIESGGR
jgi:putative heme-binding domain-containing protein